MGPDWVGRTERLGMVLKSLKATVEAVEVVQWVPRRQREEAEDGGRCIMKCLDVAVNLVELIFVNPFFDDVDLPSLKI